MSDLSNASPTVHLDSTAASRNEFPARSLVLGR